MFLKSLWADLAAWLSVRLSRAFEEYVRENSDVAERSGFRHELGRRFRGSRDAMLVGPAIGGIACVAFGVMTIYLYFQPAVTAGMRQCNCSDAMLRNSHATILLALLTALGRISMPFLVAGLKLLALALTMSIPVSLLRIVLSGLERNPRDRQFNIQYSWWWERYERTVVLPIGVILLILFLPNILRGGMANDWTQASQLLWIVIIAFMACDALYLMLQRQWGWHKEFGSRRLFRNRIASLVGNVGDILLLGLILTLVPNLLGGAIVRMEQALQDAPTTVYSGIIQMARDFGEVPCVECLQTEESQWRIRFAESESALPQFTAFVHQLSRTAAYVVLLYAAYGLVSTLMMHAGLVRTTKYVLISALAALVSRVVIGLILRLYGLQAEAHFATTLAVVVGVSFGLFFARYRAGLVEH